MDSPQHGPSELSNFNCPLCGSTQAHVTIVPRPSGAGKITTAFYKCAGCTVLVRDVTRFQRLVRYSWADFRKLHRIDADQRSADAMDQQASLADLLGRPDE